MAQGYTRCGDIDEVAFSSKKTRLGKQEGETGLATFFRWLNEQADGWCEAGLCLEGSCDGHTRDTRVRLLKETDEYIEVRFRTTIYCRCSGEHLPTQESSGGGGVTGTGCACTQAAEDAEFQQMIGFYIAAVNNARATGYQAGNDPGYSDPGLGFHRVGNCADWQQVSWSALVTRSWRCWKVQKIRARQYWSVFSYHHFVRLEATCSGRVVYLDPWITGAPDVAEAADFRFEDGNGWAHTVTHTHAAGAAPRDPGND